MEKRPVDTGKRFNMFNVWNYAVGAVYQLGTVFASTNEDFNEMVFVYGGLGAADPKGPLVEAPALQRMKPQLTWAQAFRRTLPVAFITGLGFGILFDPAGLREGPDLDIDWGGHQPSIDYSDFF